MIQAHIEEFYEEKIDPNNTQKTYELPNDVILSIFLKTFSDNLQTI